MRLAISSIAWDVADDENVAALLRRAELDAVDVAPGKYFPEPARATPDAIERVRRWWADRGIEITGMQALLFGTTGLNVFGDARSRAALQQHLAAVFRIGAALRAPRLVFGSPKSRDRGALDDAQAEAAAVEFFRGIGALARAEGVTLCLEPNPKRYGCNFMVDSAEAARIVELVGDPAIRMQLDTGSLAINGEDAEQVLRRHGHLIGHVHASEPDLVPLGEGNADHARAGRALQALLPEHVVCVEMLAPAGAGRLPAIDRALGVAKRCYGSLA